MIDTQLGYKDHIRLRNISSRLEQHRASGLLGDGVSVFTSNVTGGRVQREIAEHLRIHQITGGVPARFSGAVVNRRDPIGPLRSCHLTSFSKSFEIGDDEHGFGNCMLIRSGWSDLLSRTWNAGRFRCLRLSESMGWKDDSVEFLETFPKNYPDSIEIYSERITNITPLRRFDGLKKIGLATKDAEGFESSQFPHLEVLTYSWTKSGHLDVFPDSLKTLMIDRYPKPNLNDIPPAKNLENLLIGARRLKDLSGIEKFPNLKKLELLDVVALDRIDELSCLKKLEDIVLFDARKIKEIGVVSNFNLISLSLSGLPKLKSLSPLRSLETLKYLTIDGSTIVNDGDLSPITSLSNLRDLVLVPRRRYHPAAREVQEVVNGRRRN